MRDCNQVCGSRAGAHRRAPPRQMEEGKRGRERAGTKMKIKTYVAILSRPGRHRDPDINKVDENRGKYSGD